MKVELENFPELEDSGLTTKTLIFLQTLRYMVGMPIHITSAARPQDKDSAHSEGVAIDISDNARGQKLSSTWRHRILRALYALGVERIGDYDRHIHFDFSITRPQGVTWWSESS